MGFSWEGTRGKRGFGLLRMRVFGGPRVGIHCPGLFGGPILIAVIGVDVNDLDVTLNLDSYPSFCGDLATGHPPIPLGITVGGDLLCLPMVCAEPEERVFLLQFEDKFGLDVERCGSPSNRSLISSEKLCKEAPGCLANMVPRSLQDFLTILILHVGRKDQSLRFILGVIFTTSPSAFAVAVVFVVLPHLDRWEVHVVELWE